ncbi:MAG: redox-sensing transcriptional repressor Rex [Anaerolineales bacterium]|nr:redox-sensing transcriptional repressor Rex [Anaerolineales bacterium]
MVQGRVPDIIVGRLPLYLRALSRMQEAGKEVTSSQDLGTLLGISSAQIRKDLSQFGEFGKQGTGYNVAFLIAQLRRILQVERVWNVALIGVGDLGRAIANYGGFVDRGFRIVVAFESDAQKIGQSVGTLVTQDMARLEQEVQGRGIRLAMLAVPAAAAQDVTDRLVACGVRGILCYAPTSISVPAGVQVRYTDPVLHLQHMTFYFAPD